MPALRLQNLDEEARAEPGTGRRQAEASRDTMANHPLSPRAALAGPGGHAARVTLGQPRPGPTSAAATTSRDMRIEDLRAAHALSQAEQWPHRLSDWGAAAALGEGVLMERGGRLAGTGMRWRWGAEHATVGLVIVHGAHRGQGLGKRLIQQLLAPLGQRSVLLHATAAGLPLYEKLGFRTVGRTGQHQGELLACPAVKPPTGMQLGPAAPHDLDALVALDARGAGMPRREAVAQLLQLGQAVVLRQDDRPVGFAVCRPFGRGLVVGPVAAEDRAAAQALIGSCLRTAVQTSDRPFVRLDVHAGSGLEDWLVGLNLRHVGGAVAMVRGDPPWRGPGTGGWALISQSLG